jgi:ribosomal protein S18 acetylase RimI-like enzyme
VALDVTALAQLGHANWIAFLAASVAIGPRGLVVREGGIAGLLGHVPMHYYNQILVEHSDATQSALADAVALGREREDPFVVSLRKGVDDRFAPLVARLGLVVAEDAGTLAMGLSPVRGRARISEPQPALEIRRVVDETGLDEHRRVVTAGFAADASVAEAMMNAAILERPEISIYVGYLDGEPVTAGLGWRTGRTIGVNNIATIPAARRRGFGEAMTARVLADGEAAGCSAAVLQASPMGRPIYERLGFRATARYAGYVEPTHGGG